MTLPSWLQNYVERHTASVINEQVSIRIWGSDFLQSSVPSEVACFQRNEIQTGSLLGSGNFSDVFEVSNFKLLRTGTNPSIEDARATCRWNAKRGINKYAIKFPKRPGKLEVFRSSRCSKRSSRREGSSNNRFPEYTKAAIDLILEGKYLSALDHKNIVKVRGLSWGPSPFIIMDRLEDTLDQRIARWREEKDPTTTLREKANYALQMAEAVAYLHKKRLLVRDLKPANVGFSAVDAQGNDCVQLFDFGLCRELPQSSYGDNQQDCFRMSVAGTMRYMAVEIVNTGFYGLKADVYSWAFVCYEMLTLEVPFANFCASPAMFQRLVAREGERPQFPECAAVPTCLQKLIQHSWTHATTDRLDMSSVCSQLRALIDTDFGSITPACPKRVRATNSLPSARPGAVSPLDARPTTQTHPNQRPSLASSNSVAMETRRSAMPPFLV